LVELSSSETAERIHQDRAHQVQAGVALPESRAGSAAAQLVKVGMVDDQGEAKRDHNWPDPCAHPDDQPRASDYYHPALGSRYENPGGKEPGAPRRARPPRR